MRAAALAAALLAAFPAAAQSGRTVTWFLQNPEARAAQLRRCWDDEAVARQPECANAQRAAEQAGPRLRMREPAPTPDQILTSPRYYAENAIAREIMLDKCSRGDAPPADCRAAVSAHRRR